MIRPPGFAGAAFGTTAAGDLRSDEVHRALVAAELGISANWAFVRQVHGAAVVEAEDAGELGEADAILVRQPGLPVAVATADCVPIILEADDAAAVIHAGWRGAIAGVVPATLAKMRSAGSEPRRAAVGPAIGACCYEVGTDVAERFPGFVSETTWGATSVDIPGYVAHQLAGLEVWTSSECTFTSDRMHSWRRNATPRRQVAVAWLPAS